MKTTHPRLHPVILAGGSGTRFWPLSRQKRPKQLLPLASERPLIAETVARLEGICDPADVITVCGRAHAASVRRALPVEAADGLLVEPLARNTAAAIGLAATVVAARDPEGIVVVLPSDHAVLDRPAFHAALLAAAEVAAQGPLVTIGLEPSRPETGFGYIRRGGAHPAGGRAREVLAFVEKPDRERAEGYLRAGDYLWNAGMFVFRADRMLEELRTHLPACADALEKIAPTVGKRTFASALAQWFPTIPSISIDFAVMEKADDLAVIPASFGWSDLGSFASLHEVREADAEGNVVDGDVLFFDAANNVVVGHRQKPVALIGCSDLVVVDTGDALLICPRDRSQEVRLVVDALAARGDRRLL